MRYVYIPVDFEGPTDADFEAFREAFDPLGNTVVHIHCIYNARVSAFMYRYAKAGFGGEVSAAFSLMDGIWRPGGVWASFIGDKDAVSLPNRFAAP